MGSITVMDLHIQKTSSPKHLPFTDPKVDLGFGKIFTDHMFLSRYTESKGWHSAEVTPYGPLQMDPAASVLHYGQSLFEGLKAFRREDGSIWIFRPEYNWKRMCEGADRLTLPQPSREIFIKGLKELLQLDQRWVPPAVGSSLYIRPTLIGSEGFLGLRPAMEALFFIILSPVGSYYAEGNKPVKIWLETTDVRAPIGGLGAVKAGANYAASLRASVSAKKKGCSQVLWLDTKREGIEEVGTMNVFFVLNDEIVTPALNGSILPGSMRDSVLQILRGKGKSLGKKVSERRITIAELSERHARGELLEAFGTGTAAV
ncbi:MAG: branched-chain amino acid aminotransferase, partial [Proteobacteria bacterium]